MQNKADNLVYAGFFVRLAAYIIDLIIVGTASIVVRFPIWLTKIANPDNFLVTDFIFEYSVADILFYLLSVTYFVLLTYFTGSTLGKKLFNIKIISTEGRKYTFFEILFRETVGRFLAELIIYIGYFVVGIDKNKRGLHDYLSDTCVVYCHEKKVYVDPPVYYNNINTSSLNIGNGVFVDENNIQQ